MRGAAQPGARGPPTRPPRLRHGGSRVAFNSSLFVCNTARYLKDRAGEGRAGLVIGELLREAHVLHLGAEDLDRGEDERVL